jgi:hypothetical protein
MGVTLPDLIKVQLGIPDEAQIRSLGSGLSSDVFLVGHEVPEVFKVNKKPYRSLATAEDRVGVFTEEQDAVEDCLGPEATASAAFTVVEGERGLQIVLRQPFLDGTTIEQALLLGCDPERIKNYLSGARGYYKNQGVIPDLACAENQWFNPLVDPNTVVVGAGDDARPVCVDTTYGRLQRNRLSGPIISRLIYDGLGRALKNLE